MEVKKKLVRFKVLISYSCIAEFPYEMEETEIADDIANDYEEYVNNYSNCESYDSYITSIETVIDDPEYDIDEG